MCFKLVLIEDINQCAKETLLEILNESMDSEANINVQIGQIIDEHNFRYIHIEIIHFNMALNVFDCLIPYVHERTLIVITR